MLHKSFGKTLTEGAFSAVCAHQPAYPMKTILALIVASAILGSATSAFAGTRGTPAPLPPAPVPGPIVSHL